MMQLGLLTDHMLTRQSSPPVASIRPEPFPRTTEDTLLLWATISSAQNKHLLQITYKNFPPIPPKGLKIYSLSRNIFQFPLEKLQQPTVQIRSHIIILL